MEEVEKQVIRTLLTKYGGDYVDYEDCVKAALEHYHGVKNANIIAEADSQDYQGDTFYIIEDKDNPNQFYYITFGYGSCGGCDMLQSYQDNNCEECAVEELNRSIMPLKRGFVGAYLEKEKQNTWNKELLNELISKVPAGL